MDDRKIPRRISPAPLIDSVVEIRFQPAVPTDAVFGLTYHQVKKDFPLIQKLPILQLPDEIRNSDPNLIYKPYYKMESPPYILQIGPRVLAFSAEAPYPGWDQFAQQTSAIIGPIYGTGIIQSVSRVALRNINFFDHNVFDYIALSVRMHTEPLSSPNTFIRTELISDQTISTIQVTNRATITHGANKPRVGSILDIETSNLPTHKIGTGYEDFSNILSECHAVTRRLFFSLLTPSFLETLNPEY